MRVRREAFRKSGRAANVQFQLENQFASVVRQQHRPRSQSLLRVGFRWQAVRCYRDCLVLGAVGFKHEDNAAGHEHLPDANVMLHGKAFNPTPQEQE
eukprot:CAMPEP_0198649334 /NCGR_PEP_ID=MMETSP1467-20131203/4185_1 /TAXON_ID=1462469 /ORGANISM="unid. sp., Strain CCMP2135" /LENGTH=96 /DNA_ID=CAMNT_0044385113 /DNA_START=199 /DNA_END=489 /DNA_ORIENTATION=+